ncbi:hypothetical protein C7Y47_24045 [Lysinibacillus sphaericus]|uniref:Uncharacterized protein n=1 Tax=Lysinibacillus sphaericus TaxID=1421 RepID=A0A544U7G1_LYSSH|nr:hypothetical protein [Lysinibacillus sp. SDF0037]TQR26861.1 hypothetical protein C7Y47_24045 [Lysinibacillus sp. SDF0037]
MEKRSEKFKKINPKSIGKYYFLIGISIAFSIISSKWAITHNAVLSNVFEIYSPFEMILLIVGLILFIEGIYYYSKPKNMSFIIFLPYINIFAFIWYFYSFNNNNRLLAELDSFTLITFLFLIWISVFYELFKLCNAIKKIIKNSSNDSKDRLSIVITVIATIISAIALFK